ncbi:hypothetical protein FOZ63_023418, partial [Perkinsus olseni]
VERFHRFVNEYLRSHGTDEKTTYSTYCTLVQRSCSRYNVLKRADGTSPHEAVFKFHHDISVLRPRQCRPGYSYIDQVLHSPSQGVLKSGMKILVRTTPTPSKLCPRWSEAEIVEPLGSNRARVKLDNNPVVVVHSVDLKLLH